MSEITELILQENSEPIHYSVNQNIICNVEYLKYVQHVKKCAEKPNSTYDTTVLPYMFFPYTDNGNDLNRHVLLKKISYFDVWIPESKIQINFSCDDEETDFMVNPYSEDEAEEKYLKSNPVSFLVLSKPNVGEIELAKILSMHWKCVLITPESVLREEIESKTRVGECIKFNLQNGRSIGPEVILRLVERRVKSQIAQHCGFVIAGFPLIPNNNCKDDPLSSESAVFNVYEIFEEFTGNIFDFSDSPSSTKVSKVTLEGEISTAEDFAEDAINASSKNVKKKKWNAPESRINIDMGTASKDIIKNAEYFAHFTNTENQLDFLFSLVQNPTVIIYVYCSNLDVVNKVDSYRFNVHTEKETSLYKDYTETAFSPDITSKINIVDTEDDEDINDYKYMIKLPIHLKPSISAQLLEYKYYIQSTIDKQILQHDPELYIKVDGRLSASKMFHSMRLRLKCLGFQPVLIPELLTKSVDFEDEFGEESPQVPVEYKSLEEAFAEYKSINVVNNMYKWQLSNWGFKCPVALKHGVVMKGTAKNAVKFMNKIYFLSDESALQNFCHNPRPYLLPVRPRPNYRIFIIGPKLSGRTAVSQCLSYLFRCEILDPNILEKQYKVKKQCNYLENVKTAAIAEALMMLEQLRETEKQERINIWLKNTVILLKTEFPEFKSASRTFSDIGDTVERKSSVNSDWSDQSVASVISERTHSEMINDLEKLNIPINDKSKIKVLLEDHKKILQYLPYDLKKPIKTPTVFDPFVSQYVSNIVENIVFEDNALSSEELVDMYRSAIGNVENIIKNNNSAEKCEGWIIDGLPPDLEVLKEFNNNEMANEIICLKDIDPEHNFLLEKYKKGSTAQFKEFKDFFKSLRRFSAAERASSIDSVNRISFSLQKNNAVSSPVLVDNIETVDKEEIQTYTDHLNAFYSKWEEAKTHFITVCCDPPIEINIANKNISELLAECILKIESKYKKAASVFNEEDRIQEMRDFGGNLEPVGEEEEEVGGEEEEAATDNIFLENRRYGNMREYCPVAFQDHFVLWKGKENLCAQFESKLYFFSSQIALDKFIYNPYSYVSNMPFKIIPPPRICIVGSIGCGKSTVAVKIAKNLGLFYINFEREVLNLFDLNVTKKLDDIILDYKENVKKNNISVKSIDILNNYLYDEGTLPDYVLKNILNPLWCNSPYRETGFVIDNFPRKDNDIKYMLENVCIPDTIIQLHATQEEVHDRIFELKVNQWKEELEMKKQQKEVENTLKFQKWEIEFKEKIDFLVEAMKEERKQEFLLSQPPIPPYSSPVDSYIALPSVREEEEEEEELNMFIYDPEQKLEDLEEIKLKVEEEMPKPEFTDVWESVEEASERIEIAVGEIYTRDINNLNDLKELLAIENIEYVSFNTNKSLDQVFFVVSKYVENFKFRNNSLFERVYSISIDVAEKLLEQGYFFLSRFGRTCPVEIYEKINPLQMFLISKQKMLISPVIHRRYIYFICGSSHLDKFKRNPLMYTENIDYRLPLFPLKMAILGPPKCGKSCLADKIQKEFGLKIITCGQAVRYVLKHLSFCELAKNMRTVLEKGWSLTDEMIAGAVEALTLDGRSIAQGYILDGFPTSVEEMLYLRNIGVVPYIVLDISAGLEKVKECVLSETGKRNIPPYSFDFFNIRYNIWKNKSVLIKTYLHEQFQNIYTISNSESKWNIWNQAKEIIFSNMMSIIHYYKNRDLNLVLPLRSLLISPLEFEEKQSCIRNYCPCCLHFNNHLVSGGNPIDRNGVVQYRDYYYWICQSHIKEFTDNAWQYLPPATDTYLPDDLPYESDDCFHYSYQNGICIVTYWDSQPKHVIKYGNNKYTVLYKDLCYIFCSRQCMEKFLKEPHIYFDKVVHFRDYFPLELNKSLPILGYLEQHVSNLIIQALITTEFSRPVHPFMDINTCAAMNMALYLKINNPKMKKEFLPLYEEFKKKFDDRREVVNEFLNSFHKTNNPFLDFLPSNIVLK